MNDRLEDGALARRLGSMNAVLRWLAAELAAERHPLSHVPIQLANALTDVPVGGCRGCGGPLPKPQRTGQAKGAVPGVFPAEKSGRAEIHAKRLLP
jgi:hypothetical protein